MQYGVSLALLYRGCFAGASADRKTGGRFGQAFSEDMVVHFNYLPTLRVQIAITPAALID